MLQLLSSFADTIVSLVRLVISTLTSFTNLISNIPQYVSFLTSSIGFLPDIIVPFAIATVSILVVLFIIGR